MARDFTKVNLDIWNDPDFLGLPPAAQHLYLLLWTSPALTYCGTHDWRPGRLAARSSGFTAEHVQTVADCLVARHFLVIDHETEEVLVRSWARFDEVMKQPRLAVSYAIAYATVASQSIKAVLTHELGKIQQDAPDLTCWADKRVAALLAHPSVSAKDLPTPPDPFGDGFGDGLALGLPQTRGKVSPRVSGSPTTATTTTTSNKTTEVGDKPPRAAKRRRLPDDFRPSDEHLALASELGVDLRAEWHKFVDHWKGNGETKADWSATLRNWIRRASEQPIRGVPKNNVVRLNPDGEPILPPPITKDYLR